MRREQAWMSRSAQMRKTLSAHVVQTERMSTCPSGLVFLKALIPESACEKRLLVQRAAQSSVCNFVGKIEDSEARTAKVCCLLCCRACGTTMSNDAQHRYACLPMCGIPDSGVEMQESDSWGTFGVPPWMRALHLKVMVRRALEKRC